MASLNLVSAYSRSKAAGACECCVESESDDDQVHQLSKHVGRSLLPNAVSARKKKGLGGRPGNSYRQLDVSLPDIQFSAAHFVTMPGFRERLHGHNYSVSIRMGSQEVQPDGYIVDFGDVKKAARAVCQMLKERTLIPVLSDAMHIKYVENQSGTSRQNVELLSRWGSVQFSCRRLCHASHRA
jgi:hypothetical protein